MHHPHHCPHPPHTPHGTCGGHEQGYFDYDPADHKHHHHGPHYIVDKCADECDDQLPLFSQVGRGLQGEGYRVVVSKDSDDGTETELSGYYTDPHTGEMVYDWTSENINGGRLYYSYHIRNFTDPQTFTITFRYVRPNRDADEEGTVWSWTSPAIPYVGDEDMGDLIASWVSTLYLRKNGEAWDWRRHEKLTYPEGMTHQSVNAPGPNEGWTVNLTYGLGKQEDDPTKDCDIQVPTLQELAKIIGMKPEWILELLEEAVPTNVIPQGMTVKEYIDDRIESVDRTYNVTSTDTGLLTVNKSTANKETNFALTPKVPIGGDGIKVARDGNNNVVISADIREGYGIQIKKDADGSLTIINTQVGGDWKDLEPGKDFEYTWHNGWYINNGRIDPPFTTTPSTTLPPRVMAIPSFDDSGKLIGGEIWIGASSSESQYLENKDDLLDSSKFKFKHSAELYSIPQSAMVSITFKGDYARLNNTSVIKNDGGGSIWNTKGTNSESFADPDANWWNCGASWPVNLYVLKEPKDANGNILSGYKKFVFGATSIADGYNAEYSTPNYGVSHLAITPWANWSHYITMGNYQA